MEEVFLKVMSYSSSVSGQMFIGSSCMRLHVRTQEGGRFPRDKEVGNRGVVVFSSPVCSLWAGAERLERQGMSFR